MSVSCCVCARVVYACLSLLTVRVHSAIQYDTAGAEWLCLDPDKGELTTSTKTFFKSPSNTLDGTRCILLTHIAMRVHHQARREALQSRGSRMGTAACALSLLAAARRAERGAGGTHCSPEDDVRWRACWSCAM